MGFGILLERIWVMVICYISVDGFADQRMKKRETRNKLESVEGKGTEKNQEDNNNYV